MHCNKIIFLFINFLIKLQVQIQNYISFENVFNFSLAELSNKGFTDIL